MCGSNPDPLDFIQRDAIDAPVIELGCLGVRVAGQVLGRFDPSLGILQVRSDSRRPKRVIADIRRNSCRPGTSLCAAALRR